LNAPTLTRLFESALNRYLGLDPDALARMGALSGKVIAFEMSGLRCYLKPGTDGIEVRDSIDGAPDATVRGTPWAMLRMALPGQGREAFRADAQGRASVAGGRMPGATGAVEISGDVELGRRFKELLDGIVIDWEEQLSRLTGDVIAHQIGRSVRAAHAFGTDTLHTLGRNFAEYQQFDARNLPAATEVAEFLAAVDVLRDDTARLEARIARLQARLAVKDGVK